MEFNNMFNNDYFEDYVDNLIEISNRIDITKKTLLTGRNAGGKSFIRKLLISIIHNKYKLEGKRLLKIV